MNSPTTVEFVEATELMTPEDTLRLRNEALDYVSLLTINGGIHHPTLREERLTQISTTGDVPMTLRRRVGERFAGMTYCRTESDREFATKIKLFGSHPLLHRKFHQIAPLTAGIETSFSVTPFGLTEPTAELATDDIAFLIDGLVNARNKIAAQGDPRRNPLAIDVVRGIGDGLKRMSGVRQVSRIFSDSDLIESGRGRNALPAEFFAERRAKLSITDQRPGGKFLILSMRAPIDVPEGRIIEEFSFTFPESIKKQSRKSSMVLRSSQVGYDSLYNYMLHRNPASFLRRAA